MELKLQRHDARIVLNHPEIYKTVAEDDGQIVMPEEYWYLCGYVPELMGCFILHKQGKVTVECHVQVGEGIATGQGSDPQLMIRYSDDGGLTYSAEEMYPLGKGGDYLRKVELYQQGMAEQRVYELSYSEPTKFALFSAHADIDFG